MAKEVSLVPVRVTGCDGVGYQSQLLAGIDWVIAHHRPGQPAVANISLGGPASSVVDAAVRALVADGVTVVAAAGNDGVDACDTSPARAPDAIAVGAIGPNDARATFSNYGSCLALFAPGVQVPSAWPTSSTASAVATGTSMAAPHVAGAAALLIEAEPGLSPADVARRITGTATTGAVTDAGAGSPNRILNARRLGRSEPTSPGGAGTAPPSDATHFKDVPRTAYYHDAVYWAAAGGITAGTSATTFSPAATVTRADAATFLWRSQDEPAATSATRFSDVPLGSYYHPAVGWASSVGIAQGVSPTLFAPRAGLTRQQAVTMLWRLAGRPTPTTTSGFRDVDPAGYAAQAISWGAEQRLTKGTTPTTFSPDAVVSRAEMVTFLHRLLAG
jgi:hypothetical protein